LNVKGGFDEKTVVKTPLIEKSQSWSRVIVGNTKDMFFILALSLVTLRSSQVFPVAHRSNPTAS
jgi:hypothetical protein